MRILLNPRRRRRRRRRAHLGTYDILLLLLYAYYV